MPIWAYAIAVASIFGAGYYEGAKITHKADLGVYNALVAADAKAQAEAISITATAQKSIDNIALAAANKEAQAQTNLAARYAALAQKVSVHVTPKQDAAGGSNGHPGCVTFGLVRNHDGAALGIDPASLPLPAGATDDTCSAVAPSALSARISDNYGRASANAEQLNALQDSIRAQDAVNPSAGQGQAGSDAAPVVQAPVVKKHKLFGIF